MVHHAMVTGLVFGSRPNDHTNNMHDTVDNAALGRRPAMVLNHNVHTMGRDGTATTGNDEGVLT